MTGRIYLDIDDVVADTIASLGELLFELHGKRVATEDVKHFDLGISYGLSKDEENELLAAAHLDPFIDAIQVVAGAVEVVSQWYDAGLEIEFLTGRPPAAHESSVRWLRRHGFRFSRFDCVDKYGRMPGQSKALELRDLPLDEYVLAIEDSLDMAEFLTKNTSATILLRDRPWNRDTSNWDAETRARVTRVGDWREIAQQFPVP